MRSFTFTLVAAALATLISAAPVALPGTGSAVGTVPASPAVGVLDKVLDPREDKSSLGFIFNDFSTGTQSYVEQLHGVSSTNADDTKIKGIVAVIKGSIDVAIPQVKALVGCEHDVIMTSVDGQVMTVDRLAALLAFILRPILFTIGALLKFVDADIKALLAVLVTDLFVLVGGVIALVDGLAAALGPLITDVGFVIVALGVDVSQYGLKC